MVGSGDMSDTFTMQIEVRFRDLDAMGHVNNAVFFTYFEEGRKAFFLTLSQDTSQPDIPSVFPFILARVSCDYLKPIGMNAPVSLQMWVGEIGTKSFGFVYRLVGSTDDVVYAKGESIQVCYDYAQGRSMEVPEALREKLRQFQRTDFLTD